MSIEINQLLDEVEGSEEAMREVNKQYKSNRLTDFLLRSLQGGLSEFVNTERLVQSTSKLLAKPAEYFQDASWDDLVSEVFSNAGLADKTTVLKFELDEEARVIERVCSVIERVELTRNGIEHVLSEAVRIADADLDISPTKQTLNELVGGIIYCRSNRAAKITPGNADHDSLNVIESVNKELWARWSVDEMVSQLGQ